MYFQEFQIKYYFSKVAIKAIPLYSIKKPAKISAGSFCKNLLN